MQRYVPISRRRDLIRELDDLADAEHPDVALSDETGWPLSAFPDGRVLCHDVEGDDPPLQLFGVGRGEVVRLLEALTRGDFSAIEVNWAV
jgi:hypothetical protein